MASSRWVCHGPGKCLQTNNFRQARPRAGVPRIVRRYRGFRQGTDNERSLALGGSAGSQVAVGPPRLRQSGSQIPAAPAGEGPRRTTAAAHQGRGSTSACPQEQQRRGSRFSAGRHLCLVPSRRLSRATEPRRSLVEEGERFGAAVGRVRCLLLACRSDGRPPRGLTAGRP